MKYFAIFAVAVCAVQAVSADLSSDNLERLTKEMETVIGRMQAVVDNFPGALENIYNSSIAAANTKIAETLLATDIQKKIDGANNRVHSLCLKGLQTEISELVESANHQLGYCNDSEVIFFLTSDFLHLATQSVELGNRYLKGLKISAEAVLIQGSVAKQFEYLIKELYKRLDAAEKNSTNVQEDVKKQMNRCIDDNVRNFIYQMSQKTEWVDKCNMCYAGN